MSPKIVRYYFLVVLDSWWFVLAYLFLRTKVGIHCYQKHNHTISSAHFVLFIDPF